MIRGRHQLTAATITTLQTWLPLTLRQAATDDDRDPDGITQPASWRRPTSRSISDWKLPLVVVTSTGTVEEPEADGDGDVFVTYELVVNPVVRSRDYEETADLASIYAAAIRACLEQHRTLGVAWVTDLRWVAETFEDEEPDQQRTVGEALLVFHVDVGPVHNRFEPPTEDGEDAPTVEETNVTVDHLEEE